MSPFALVIVLALVLLVVSALVAVVAVTGSRRRRAVAQAATGLGWRMGVSPDVAQWSGPVAAYARGRHGARLDDPNRPVIPAAVAETVRSGRRISAGRFVCLTRDAMTPGRPLSNFLQLVVVHLAAPHPPHVAAEWAVSGPYLYHVRDLGVVHQLAQLDIDDVERRARYLLSVAEQVEPHPA